jgi:hypothetical protein
MATAKADTVGVTLNDLRGTAVPRLALAAYTETEITVSFARSLTPTICTVIPRSRKTLSGSSKCEGISQLTAQRALDTLVVQGGKPSEINGGGCSPIRTRLSLQFREIQGDFDKMQGRGKRGPAKNCQMS